MKRIRRVLASALLVAAAVLPLACASGERQGDDQSGESYRQRHTNAQTESNFEREKAQSSNSGNF
jgi:hypothetical protein